MAKRPSNRVQGNRLKRDASKGLGAQTSQLILGPGLILLGYWILRASGSWLGTVPILVGFVMVGVFAYRDTKSKSRPASLRQTKQPEGSLPVEAPVSGDRLDYGPVLPGPTPSSPSSFAPPEGPGGTQGKPRETGYMRAGEWIPPQPEALLVESWGPGKRQANLIGVDHKAPVVYALLGGASAFEEKASVTVSARGALVADRLNPYSPAGFAVAVYVAGQHVGYLPDEPAALLWEQLKEADTEGMSVTVPTSVRGRLSNGTLAVSATVSLPEGGQLLPPTSPDGQNYLLIPRGRKRQVSGEGKHVGVLRQLLQSSSSDLQTPFSPNPGPQPGSSVQPQTEPEILPAALRRIVEQRPRSVRDVVQVEIGGQAVGVLSDVQSAAFLPLVSLLEESGKVALVRAAVEGSFESPQVVFWAQTLEEIEPSWRDALAPASGASSAGS